MKRSAFIAWLIGMAGIAEAQTTWGSTGTINWNPRLGTAENHLAPIDTHWSDAKPKNNQCPVCGTMAKPYKRELNCASGFKNNFDGTFSTVPAPCGDPNSQEQRITRCSRCSAAFFQDAVA